MTALLRQAGWTVNRKRVERIWRKDGLKVPQKQPKRGRLWFNDGSCIRLRPAYPGHVWAYDLVEGHIDLRAKDASAAKTGDQAFRFVGTNAFHAAGDLRLSTDSAGINILSGDVNGDHVADFVINLGHSVVSASDIFL